MIEIDSNSFAKIADIARREAGLHLTNAKIGMVHARLQKRIRKLGLKDYHTYCALLADESASGLDERRSLVEALTTNVTHFFRESHHFPIITDYFKRHRVNQPHQVFRVWSAGCSNGAEPISICLQLYGSNDCTSPNDISIFASDIDGTALKAAEIGRYANASISAEYRSQYANFLDQHSDDTFSLTPKLRDRIEYQRASLLAPPPNTDLFDAIFCRNVTIYFDTDTATQVHMTLISMLKVGGLLCLGHSERLAKTVLEKYCERVGPTAYEKISQGN